MCLVNQSLNCNSFTTHLLSRGSDADALIPNKILDNITSRIIKPWASYFFNPLSSHNKMFSCWTNEKHKMPLKYQITFLNDQMLHSRYCWAGRLTWPQCEIFYATNLQVGSKLIQQINRSTVYHMSCMCDHSPLMLIFWLLIMSSSFNFLKRISKHFFIFFLQIYYHVLKLLYLLPGVAPADLAVGHCAVSRGCEMVKGSVVTVTVTGFLRQRQSRVAWTGAMMRSHRNMEVVVRLRLLVYLKLPVACCLESSTRHLF